LIPQNPFRGFVCFRCQVRGDAIAFVQELEELSFETLYTG